LLFINLLILFEGVSVLAAFTVHTAFVPLCLFSAIQLLKLFVYEEVEYLGVIKFEYSGFIPYPLTYKYWV